MKPMMLAFIVWWAGVWQGVWAVELVVAQVAPLSDPDSIGNQVRAGIQMYFDVVNRSGGLNGAKLRLITRNRGLEPEDAVAKTRELLQTEQPLALVGLIGTAPMEALLSSRLIDEHGIPVVGMRTGASSLHGPGKGWLFHTRAGHTAEVERISRHLATLGAVRTAVFHEASAFGREALELVEQIAPRHGLSLVARASYASGGTDVAAAVASVTAAAPHSVIVAANSAAAAEFYKAYRSAGGAGAVIALSTADGALIVKRIGASAARGFGIAHVVPDPGSASLPLARELQAHKRDGTLGRVPLSHGVVEGYVAAKVLVEGLRRAGASPTRARLRQALESISGHDVGGLLIGFSATRRAGTNHVDIAIVNHEGRMLR